MNEIYLRWLKKAYELSETQELYMPCTSLKEQKALTRELVKAHNEIKHADILGTPAITITGIHRDGKQYICFRKVTATPLTAYIKDVTTGDVRKVSMEEKDERERRLKLMQEDGITLEQAKEIEEVPLTKEEEGIWKS